MSARTAGLLVALGLLAPGLPALADTHTVHTEMTDRQTHDRDASGNTRDEEHVTIDTVIDSDRGDHWEEHTTSDVTPEGSQTHEAISGKGTYDESGKHWVDDGSTYTDVSDTKRTKDGTTTEHHEERITDADGNTEIYTRDTVADPSGKVISKTESTRRETKPKPPEEPTPTEPTPKEPPRPRPKPEPPIGNLAGTFSLDQTNLMGTFRYSGQAQLADTGKKGDGEYPDYAQWTMTGVVTNGTAAFTKGDQTCTLADEARKPIPRGARFRVLKGTRTARWELGMLTWSYRCTKEGAKSGGGAAVILHFATRTGTYCAGLAEVPTPNPRNPSGSFTMDCWGSAQPAIGTVTATWSFGPGG